jgi:hypothetical protein
VRHQQSGLLFIFDELGKNLEYAARNPESEDVFLLQRLAEEAEVERQRRIAEADAEAAQQAELEAAGK